MIRNHIAAVAVGVAAIAVFSSPTCGADDAPSLAFDFGADAAEPGHTRVQPDHRYSDERGYGFEGASELTATADGIASNEPFFFSVRVPEGNYRVTVTLSGGGGGGEAGATTTVKAESRRLMLETVAVPPGERVERTFTVNMRTPELPDGRQVAIKDSERASATWDEKLTLEFNGERPTVDALTIEPAPDAVTVFIAGDSTVTDGRREPWAGWGQMLPRFFGPGVAVANHAESGRALRSFRNQRRLDKVLSQMKPGDYLFIQFGHNDMKEKGEGIGPFTSYTDDLKSYIAAVRERGGTPVLVTSMHRRWWDGAQVRNTLGDYPEAVRRVAAEQNVAIIDLHAMSEVLYETLGVEGSKKAFVHYPANTFPGQDKRLKDNSHHSTYGAYQLARCVVEGIRSSGLPLASHLAEDAKPFDPAHPDSPDAWQVPPSPPWGLEIPQGN